MRALLPFLIALLPQFLLTTLAFFCRPNLNLRGLYPIILTRVYLRVHIVRICPSMRNETPHTWTGETQTHWYNWCGVFGLTEGGVLINRVLSVVLNGLLSTVLKPTRRGERPVLHTPTVCGRNGERRGVRHTDDTNTGACLQSETYNYKLMNLFRYDSPQENIEITLFFWIGSLSISLFLSVYSCFRGVWMCVV